MMKFGVFWLVYDKWIWRIIAIQRSVFPYYDVELHYSWNDLYKTRSCQSLNSFIYSMLHNGGKIIFTKWSCIVINIGR